MTAPSQEQECAYDLGVVSGAGSLLGWHMSGRMVAATK
jgi:hypothetical protein